MDRYECSNNEYMMDPGYDGVVELKDHVMSCGDGYWNGQDETGTALQQQEGILINPEFMTSMAMAQQGYDTTWGFEGTQSHFTASPELLHGFMFNPVSCPEFSHFIVSRWVRPWNSGVSLTLSRRTSRYLLNLLSLNRRTSHCLLNLLSLSPRLAVWKS